MSIQTIGDVYRAVIGDSTAKAVLAALANYCDDEGRCFPSYNTIAADTEFTRKTVMRAMAWLEEKGLVGKEQRLRGDKSHSSNMIILNLPMIESLRRERRGGSPVATPPRVAPTPGVGSQGDQGGVTELPLEPSLNHQLEPSKDLTAGPDPLGWPEGYFDWFWDNVPPHRKGQKEKCRAALDKIRRAGKVTWDTMRGGVERWRDSDHGKYGACAPMVWLNGEKWDMPKVTRGGAQGPSMFDIAAGRDRAAQQQEERDHDRRQELVERGPDDDHEIPI